MNDPSPIQAWLTIATPMFLGGSDHETSGFRLTAFKGVLRFWWRALEYPALARSQPRDKALAALQKRERWLFGAASSGDQKGIGQSRLLIQALPCQEPIRLFPMGEKLVRPEAMPGICYLGYGLMGAFGAKGGVLERSALAHGQRFGLQIRFKRDVGVEDRAGIGRALRLLGLLGGLGSRARRGWGGLSLEELKGDVDTNGKARPFAPPATREDYCSMLKSLIGETASFGLPPFTALSSFSRIDCVAEGDDPVQLLDQVGREMQRYRAWGFNGRVNGEPSEKNFRDDHDWFKDAVKGNMRARAPRRAAFGLPHNYYSSKDRAGGNVDPAGLNRRASPLAIHIHRLGDRRYIAVLSLLPADFLLDNKIAMKVGRNRETATLGADWLDTLHGFIDGRNKKVGEPYFPNMKTVIAAKDKTLPVAKAGGR